MNNNTKLAIEEYKNNSVWKYKILDNNFIFIHDFEITFVGLHAKVIENKLNCFSFKHFFNCKNKLINLLNVSDFWEEENTCNNCKHSTIIINSCNDGISTNFDCWCFKNKCCVLSIQRFKNCHSI